MAAMDAESMYVFGRTGKMSLLPQGVRRLMLMERL